MATKKKNTRIAILILILSLVLYFFLGKLKLEPEKNDQESKPPIVSSLILKKEEPQIIPNKIKRKTSKDFASLISSLDCIYV